MEKMAQEGWSEDMDAQEHLATYDGFMHFVKYGPVAVILVVVLLALITL